MDNNNLNVTPNPEWKGLTLEELRFRRAMALVRCQLSREAMQTSVEDVKEQVNTNGVRSLLFTNKTTMRLKKVDMLLLGFKAARTIYSLWRKMR